LVQQLMMVGAVVLVLLKQEAGARQLLCQPLHCDLPQPWGCCPQEQVWRRYEQRALLLSEAGQCLAQAHALGLHLQYLILMVMVCCWDVQCAWP
jgi:hypothetical protein